MALSSPLPRSPRPACLFTGVKLNFSAAAWPQSSLCLFSPPFPHFACTRFPFAVISLHLFEIGKPKSVLTRPHGPCLSARRSPLQCSSHYCCFVRRLTPPPLLFFFPKSKSCLKAAVRASFTSFFFLADLSRRPAGPWLRCLSEWMDGRGIKWMGSPIRVYCNSVATDYNSHFTILL